MPRAATTLVDLYLLSHALARFELAHHGYPCVATPKELTPDLVPTYLARVPATDPWGRPYAYRTHQVLLRRHPKAKARLSDSYELSAGIIEPTSGHLLPVRIFNGTFVEVPHTVAVGLLRLRDYPRYAGAAGDMRAALKMFRLARPLELVKLVALRAIEDTADRQAAADLTAFIRFNEPESLRLLAREALGRLQG